MTKMKKLICVITALALLIPAASMAQGSWGQINQSLERGENWMRIVQNAEELVCVPLAMELARQWLDLAEEDLNGFVNFSTTPNAYDRLTEGKANPTVTIASRGIMMDDTHPIDIVIGTGPNADERKAAEEAGKELVMVPVCYDAFVFLVNSANPVDELTADQIRQIYSGTIRLWDEVGGEKALPIAAYQRPHGSGSQTAMEELVMKGWNLTAAEVSLISDGMSDLIAQVGSYDNAREAIGYSYLYYVNGLYKSGVSVYRVLLRSV